MGAGYPRKMSSTAQGTQLVSDFAHMCPPIGFTQTAERLMWLLLTLLGQFNKGSHQSWTQSLVLRPSHPGLRLSMHFCGLEQ